MYSAGTPVTTTIAFNPISNKVGIWFSKPVVASGLFTTSFRNVTIPIPADQ